MWVRSLSREAPLEEGMGIHSSILDWRIPWTEESGIILRSVCTELVNERTDEDEAEKDESGTKVSLDEYLNELQAIIAQKYGATTNRKSSGKVKRRHHVSVHFPESLSLASILAGQCEHHQERLN